MTDSFNQRVGINDAGDGASVYKNSALNDLLDVMETTLDGYQMVDINNITEVFNDNTFNREKKRQLQVQQQNQAREQYLTQQKNSNHNNVAYLNGSSSGGTGGTGDNIHGYGDNQTVLLLPPGWFVEKDDKSGKYYYANIRTGKFTNQQNQKILRVF